MSDLIGIKNIVDRQSATLIPFGDSLTDAGSDYSIGLVNYNRFNDYSWWGWAQRLMRYPLEVIRNAGVSGEEVSQMLNRIYDDVLVYQPGWVFFLGGTNDIYTDRSASDTMADIDKIVNLCIRNRSSVLLSTIPARSDGSVNETRRSQHLLLNDMIREFASRSRSTQLVDSWRVTVNPSSTVGAERSGYNYDNLHFSNTAGYAIGKECARVLTPHIVSPISLVSSYYDTLTNNADGSNVMTDAGFFLTSEASGAAGMSGNEAANWNCTRVTGTPTSVNSLQANSQGFGNYQRMVVTSGANNDQVRLENTQGTTIAGSVAPGDWIRCECEIIVASPVNLKGVELHLGITDNNSSLNQNLRDNAYQSGSAVAYAEGFTATFRTPWHYMEPNSSPSNIHPLLTYTFAGVGGATIDVGMLSIRKASSKYPPVYIHD